MFESCKVSKKAGTSLIKGANSVLFVTEVAALRCDSFF